MVGAPHRRMKIRLDRGLAYVEATLSFRGRSLHVEDALGEAWQSHRLGAAAEPCRTISTRRFCALPAAELFGAIGRVSP